MMLEATNLNVDNIWVESFDEKILREEFDMPSEYTPFILMPLGYKTEDCPMNPLHNKRKSLEELIEYK